MKVDFEVEAECDKCGESLKVWDVGSQDTTLQIKVEPCLECLEEAKQSQQEDAKRSNSQRANM